MHKLMDLRDKLREELEKQADRPMTDSTLGLIDRLSHSIKGIDTIVAMEEASYEGGSRESRYRDGYSGAYRDSYRDGGSRESRYRDSGASGRRGGYFYTQRDDGMSGARRRDSMGRYADGYSGDDGMSGRYRDDGMSGRRGYSRDEAKDKLVNGLEGMMGEVSPEAQSAIEKAIHALERE